jgi:CRP/FNR family transcriptional regulator
MTHDPAARDTWEQGVVHRLPTFDGLPEELLCELGSLCIHRRFEHDQMVAEEQASLGFIGFVAKGIVRLQKLQADGRVHVVGLLVENDMFGRMFNGPLHFSIAATGTTEICAFPREPFEVLASRWPELERLLMLNILNELDAAREWMLILTNYRVTERLAGFLVLLCRRWAAVAKLAPLPGDRVNLTIPVSRSDLANFLGTRPESLSRAFHALADDGLIRLHTPYEIELLDLSALIELAGSEDFVLPGALSSLRSG